MSLLQLGAYVTQSDLISNDNSPTFDNSISKPALEERAPMAVIKKEYVGSNKIPVGPLSPQDILNMDIVFDGSENADSCVEPSQDANQTVPCSETIVHSDSHFIIIDCPAEPIGRAKVKVEYDDKSYTDVDNDEDHDEVEHEDYDSNNETFDSLSMKELAIVESHSVDDPNNIIYEVYAVSPITGELSDKPLDLPPDVVEQIRISIGV